MQRDENGNPIPQRPPPRQSGTNLFVKEIRARIDAYFKIVLYSVRETVPKIIGHFLVRMSQDNLQAELQTKINDNEAILESLGEPKNITERRKMLNGMIESLKASLKLLQRDPDITAASSIDEGELAEELRKEKLEQKQAK